MRKKLTFKEMILVSVMLFGMFFGAGNLIFPAFMGWQSGSNMLPSIIAFLITGVGLPLLGVAAIGISKSSGLRELSSKVGNGYSLFFTCALYLTIGPFFAIPRCATVSFSIGVEPLLKENISHTLILTIFSLIFFIIVLFLSLKPGDILKWVGKVLTPVFLAFLCVLVVTSLSNPITQLSNVSPSGAYVDNAFTTGFLEGYNTMDALASLAFGIVVVNTIKELGITKAEDVALNTVRAGIFSCIIMALIYIFTTFMGAVSYTGGINPANGGDVLAYIAQHYFGTFGLIFLAVTVTLACLKTSVGLVTSCSETFSSMFEKGPSYRLWAVIFCSVSFLIANIGLSSIISYAVPVLMFLYPLAITLILLGLFGKYFNNDAIIYQTVTGFTLFASLFDLFGALPESAVSLLKLSPLIKLATKFLPFYTLGFGWICPALIGLVAGVVIHIIRKRKIVNNTNS